MNNKNKQQEIYISTDIESDGPIPGPNSMLSLGSVALDADGNEVGSFSVNLDTTEGAIGDPDTMAWWKTQPEAWAACRTNTQTPYDGMVEYVQWVKSLPGKPVFVAFPAGYDFNFMYNYMMEYAGGSPFSFSALDGKSFAMAVMGTDYRESTKRNMPKHWFPKGLPHNHIAVDDAREQGQLFIAMLKQSRTATRKP